MWIFIYIGWLCSIVYVIVNMKCDSKYEMCKLIVIWDLGIFYSFMNVGVVCYWEVFLIIRDMENCVVFMVKGMDEVVFWWLRLWGLCFLGSSVEFRRVKIIVVVIVYMILLMFYVRKNLFIIL